MARIRRGEEGELLGFGGEDADQAQLHEYLQKALANPGGLSGGAINISADGSVFDNDSNLLYKQGDWGTAGFGEDNVTIGGKEYARIGNPYTDNPRTAGKMYQGRPFSDYASYNPTYGYLMDAGAMKELGKYNRKHWTDMGPALFAGGMFAGPIATSLGTLGGLGSSLSMPHGAATELAAGLGGGAGAGAGAGVEMLEGGAGPEMDMFNNVGDPILDQFDPGFTNPSGTPGPSSGFPGSSPPSGFPGSSPPTSGGLPGPFSSLEQMYQTGGEIATGGLGTPAQMAQIAKVTGIPIEQLASMGATGISQLAPATFLGGLPDALPTIMDSPTIPGSVPPGGGGGNSIWDNIFNPKGPVMQGIGAIGEYIGSKEEEDRSNEIMRNAQSMFDPFASERDKYKQLLSRSYLDPTYFDQDSTLANLDKRTTRETERYLAGKGFSNSGNLGLGVAENLAENRAKYALSHQNQLAQLAGAGISPATAAQAYQQGATLGNNARQGQYGAIGNFIQNLPGMVNTIKGP